MKTALLALIVGLMAGSACAAHGDSGGADASAHLLKLDARLDVVLVPYAGGGPSLAAVKAAGIDVN